MTQEQTKNLLDLLTHEKHGNLYDFICDNYWEMSKEDLKNLCKEAFALLYEKAEKENTENGKPYDNYVKLHNEYLENLKEYTSFFEE